MNTNPTELTKNTNNDSEKDLNCPNNFKKDNIGLLFYSTEAIASKCDNCSNFVYKNGIASCSYLN